MLKKILRWVSMPVIAAVSFLSLSSFASAGDCSYCQSAQYRGCRVTITYSDGTKETYDCVNYRVPIYQE